MTIEVVDGPYSGLIIEGVDKKMRKLNINAQRRIGNRKYAVEWSGKNGRAYWLEDE